MLRNDQSRLGITGGQAQYVIERLRAERRISDRDIHQYVGEIGRDISDLEQRLERLRGAAGASQSRPVASEAGTVVPRPVRRVRRENTRSKPSRRRTQASPAAGVQGRRKRKFTVTPAVLRSRELQGRYLPLLNRMPKTKRRYYANLAKEKGREAAIQEMEASLR